MPSSKTSLILLCVVPWAGLRSTQTREVIVASTTSTRDTGLLDSLLPRFEAQTGYRVKLVAVGTGQALALGERGDDIGTYLAWKSKIDLVPLVQGDPELYNVYHVLEPNPRNAPHINVAGGRAFADFTVDSATQRRIGEFGKTRFGQSLFVPDAGKPDRW
jgi:ABC-type tungstate transport system permease subunit